MNLINKIPNSIIYLSGLVIFIITAIFSYGYFHADEHFQILEFANYKLGHTPATDLPWEFHEQIRPAIQPFLAVILFKSLAFIHINNPFTYSLILRLLTALLVWFVISKLNIVVQENFVSKEIYKLFLMGSFFIWYVPFISVRFSSETWGGLTFMFAVLLLLQNFKNNNDWKIFPFIIAGLLMGFSFYFRFQMGFAILGLGLWLLFIKKIHFKFWIALIVSIILAVAICIYIDYWFYGSLVITPYNYFEANIIKHIASKWGTTPWWGYFYSYTLDSIPPLSILLLILFFTGIYKMPKNIFVFIAVTFLIFHMIAAHKELRFMFPISYIFTLIAFIGLDKLALSIKPNKILKFTFWTFLVINSTLLIYRTVVPPQKIIDIYKFTYDYSKEKKTTLISMDDSYYKLVGTQLMHFYRSPNIEEIVFNTSEQVKNYLETNNTQSILCLSKKKISNEIFNGYTITRIYCVYPVWMLKININNWQNRSQIWSIYKIEKNKSF